MLRGLEALSERLNRAAEALLAALLAVMVLAVTAQVVFRYGVQSSLTWSEEVARYSFIWGIFVGTSVAARRGQHLAVTVFVGLLPARLRAWARVFNLVLSAAFFALFVYVSALLVHNAIPQKSSALEISIAWVYLAAVIGGALTIVQLVNGALQSAAPAK